MTLILLLFFTFVTFGLTWAPRATRIPRFRCCQNFAHRDFDSTAQSIDRQSDDKYGRGISHISADLSEGDIIAYQDGTWYVDGTEVGDGSPPIIRYMLVDTIQLVWTHDCEHGVINGFDLMVNNGGSPEPCTTGAVELGSHFINMQDYIQIGPEQILARIPAISLNKKKWMDEEREMWSSHAEFKPEEEIMTT